MANRASLVLNLQSQLTLKRDSPESHFNRKGLFVHLLAKARAQVSMNLNGSADHPPREIIKLLWRLPNPILGALGFLAVIHLRPIRWTPHKKRWDQ